MRVLHYYSTYMTFFGCDTLTCRILYADVLDLRVLTFSDSVSDSALTSSCISWLSSHLLLHLPAELSPPPASPG